MNFYKKNIMNNKNAKTVTVAGTVYKKLESQVSFTDPISGQIYWTTKSQMVRV